MNTNKAVLINGIFCYDETTPREHFGQHSECERQIVCAWTNRIALAAYLGGGSFLTGTVITTVPPQPYPDATWLYAKDVDIKPVDGHNGTTIGPNGMVAHDYARLNVTYRGAEFDGSGVEEGELALDYGSETIPISQTQSAFRWGSTSGAELPILSQPHKKFTIIHFSKTIFNLAVIPTDAIKALADCVNNAPFLGAPTGQLLFKGAHSIKRFTVGGVNNWSITYDFAYRSIDWRKLYNPDAGAWQTVVYSNGDPLFAAGAFTTLGIS